MRRISAPIAASVFAFVFAACGSDSDGGATSVEPEAAVEGTYSADVIGERALQLETELVEDIVYHPTGSILGAFSRAPDGTKSRSRTSATTQGKLGDPRDAAVDDENPQASRRGGSHTHTTERAARRRLGWCAGVRASVV
jgi:hypothetical protein